VMTAPGERNERYGEYRDMAEISPQSGD